KTGEAGGIAVVLDEDYIYICDEEDGVWKVSGIRGSVGEGGGGDLTKEAADTFYAPKSHLHSQYTTKEDNDALYSLKDHSHEEYALKSEIGGGTQEPVDVSNLEKKITLLSETDPIVPSNHEKGQKFIQDNKLKVIDESFSGTTRIPSFPVSSVTDLTSKGWILNNNGMYNWALVTFRPFDGDPTTYLRASNPAGYFEVEFPTPLTFQDILILNQVESLKVEASVDGLTYETATNLTNAGKVKTEETYRLPSMKTYKKAKFTWNTAGTTDNLFEIDFLVAGVSQKVIREFRLGGNTGFFQPNVQIGLPDNAPVIQAAIDNQEKVYIPKGTYRIREMIQIPSNRHILLDKDAVLIRDKNIKSIFITKNDGTKGGYTAGENIILEGGTLD